jgi:cardiolipin synthase
MLTVFRMAVIPFFVMALILGRPRLAVWLFLVAGITDILDGAIARFCDQKTALGAFLDPMADKLILTSTYVVLAIPAIGLGHPIPIWLPVLTISRDVVIVMLSLVLNMTFSIKNFPPSVPGKLTTFVQISYAVAILLQNGYGFRDDVTQGLMWAVAFFTIFSGLHYIWRMRTLVRGVA